MTGTRMVRKRTLRVLQHRYESWLRFHTFNPRSDLWKNTQRKPTLMRNMRVGEEGDVGDAVIADEKIILGQMLFHDFQSGPAAVALGCEQRGFLRRVRSVLEPETGRRDKWLVAVLLEEHPLKYQRGCLSIFLQKFRALGQIRENGIGFREDESVVVEYR